jgi:hypothetical protein
MRSAAIVLSFAFGAVTQAAWAAETGPAMRATIVRQATLIEGTLVEEFDDAIVLHLSGSPVRVALPRDKIFRLERRDPLGRSVAHFTKRGAIVGGGIGLVLSLLAAASLEGSILEPSSGEVRGTGCARNMRVRGGWRRRWGAFRTGAERPLGTGSGGSEARPDHAATRNRTGGVRDTPLLIKAPAAPGAYDRPDTSFTARSALSIAASVYA